MSLARCQVALWTKTCLFISDREFSLGLLVLLRKCIKLLNSRTLQDLLAEGHIAFCVLVPRIHLRVIWKCSQSLIQGLVHFRRSTLKETPASTDEKSVSSENDLFASVLEKVADAVLSMAGSVQGSDFDTITNLEGLLVARGMSLVCAILAANDGKLVVLQNLLIAASVVMVMVGVDDL